MKRMFPIFILALFVLSCQQSPKTEQSDNSEQQTSSSIYERMGKEAFAQKMEEKPDKILIDVRTPEEFQGGTIEGARNINYFDDNFDAEISKLDKTKPVFIFCQSGGRSGKAFSKMKTMEFKEVYELNVGYSGWSKE